MLEQFLTIFVNTLILFLTLMITGRIYTLLSSETQTTWKEDAQASGVIMLIMFVASLIAGVLPMGGLLMMALFIFLVYNAFQLEGLMDIIVFYFILIVVSAIFNFFGLGILSLIPGESGPPVPPQGAGGYGGF